MSISTQIARLQNIKIAIKNALISQGISASNHNMEDFANDILNIRTGIDVSDTTATSSDVIDGRYFYNSEGVKTEGTIPFKSNSGDVKLQPTRTEEYRKIQFEAGYYPNEHGAYVDEMVVDDLAPSEDGTYVEAWKNYRTIGDGYFYPNRLISNFDVLNNWSDKTSHEFAMEKDVNYLFIAKSTWNSSGGSSSASIVFNSIPEILFEYDMGGNRTTSKIVIARAENTGTICTLNATYSGTSGLANKQVVQIS